MSEDIEDEIKESESKLEELKVDGLKDKLSTQRDKLSWKLSRKRRFALVGVFGLLFLIAGAYSLTSLDVLDSVSQVTDTYTEPEIEGETVEVVIDDARASPSRPEIAPEDGIRFVNRASHDLELEFDRDVETFVLEQGESRVVDVKSIVYYSAHSVEDVEFREIRAGINVQ